MLELFIYYRVASLNTATLRPMVQAMQQRLRAEHPGLQARLLQRSDALPGSADAHSTWMETYAAPLGIDADLQATIATAAAALPAGSMMGERHIEAFAPCA